VAWVFLVFFFLILTHFNRNWIIDFYSHIIWIFFFV
jgi:hypothetical protein